jgi:hypothetical protein
MKKYQRKERQLKNALRVFDQLNKLNCNCEIVNKLKSKIKKLADYLKFNGLNFAKKSKFAGLLVLALSYSNDFYAQSFAKKKTIGINKLLPNLDTQTIISNAKFADLDGDGDLDLILLYESTTYDDWVDYYSYGLVYFKNISSGNVINFQYEKTFFQYYAFTDHYWEIYNSFDGFNFNIVDLDNDGDYDILYNLSEDFGCTYDYENYEYDCLRSFSSKYIKNNGTNINPKFSNTPSTIFEVYNEDIGSYSDCIDIDGDKYKDIIYSTHVRKNISNIESIQFETISFESLNINGTLSKNFVFKDLDNDNDYDLLSSFWSSFNYSENTGSSILPEFNSFINNPFNLNINFGSNPGVFEDIDNDGWLDFIHERSGEFRFYKNSSTLPLNFENYVVNPFNLQNVPTNLKNLFYLDFNGDGKKDILCYDNKKIFFYLNNDGIQVNNDNFIKLYPNPGNEKVFIELPNKENQIHVKIHNSIGSEIHNSKFVNEMKIEIPTTGFASGIYYFEININDEKSRLKWVKK